MTKQTNKQCTNKHFSKVCNTCGDDMIEKAVEKCRQQTIEELLLAMFILPKATAVEILKGVTTVKEWEKYKIK